MRRFSAACVLLAMFVGNPVIAGEEGAATNCRPKPGEDFYPPEAIRKGHVGAVLVEYSVKDAGPPTQVVVVQMKAPIEFRAAALRLVKTMVCSPTQQWKDEGGAAKRLRANILFKLRGVDRPVVPIDSESGIMEITGTPIQM